MSELFNVVFAGEISGRADPAVVRANVGKLFNASEAVLDRLFSGQPVAVKKMVDRATAMKIRALMKQAGAETRLVQVDEQGRPVATTAAAAPATSASGADVAASTPPPPSAPAPAPAGSMAARLQEAARQQAQEAASRPSAASTSSSASADTPAGNWVLKPVGTRLSDPDTGPPPVVPDVSGISVAAAGTDLIAENEKPVIAPVQVNISGITMAAVGSDVLNENEKRKVEAVQVDISGISMAPVGAPLDEIREEKKPVNPDISHLKLAE